MASLERYIREGWFNDPYKRRKLKSLAMEIFETIGIFGYWFGTTYLMFHFAFDPSMRNVLTLIISLLVGWMIAPIGLVLYLGYYLSTIHLNW
jgi:hypothetical protein